MRPELALAKLTAKTSRMRAVVTEISSGAYSATEIAGALAGFNSDGEKLEKEPYLLGVVKFLQAQASFSELHTLSTLRVTDLVRERCWRHERGWAQAVGRGMEPSRQLSLIALGDCIGSQKCEVCEGRKWVFPEGSAPVECKNCLATGVASPSGRTLAAQFGVDEAAWRRYWGRKYRPIIAMVHGWEMLCLWHVVEKLGE